MNLADTREARWRVTNLLASAWLMSLVSATVSQACAADVPPSPYAAILRIHGIEPDSAGLAQYLRRLVPKEEERRESLRLVEKLGSKLFSERETATKRLMALPLQPLKALRVAAESGDLEVSSRAKRILAVPRSQRLVPLYAAFKTVERDKVSGLIAELLGVAEQCDQRYLTIALGAAMQATTRPEDVALLRAATKNADKAVVIAAIRGLRSLGSLARDDLQRLMEHQNSEVSLAAAKALADQGDRASLAGLVKLLDAASLEVRVGAIQALRRVSDSRHSYSAYDDAQSRKEAIARWATWVTSEGRTAELHFPLQRDVLELGHTLITIASQDKVIELDARGNQTWEKGGLSNPWGCTGLAGAYRLLSSRDGRYVVEYDAGGNEVWRKDDLPEAPINLERLDNGNTLVAFFVAQKVMEIRPDGSVGWEIAIKGGPVDVQRLEDGHTLITLHQPDGRIVEVDHEGTVIWELKDLDMPMTGQRLENGNTLVAEYAANRVAEWDRNGTIVWQSMGVQKPYSAQRLANGNTLIAHLTDVREVDQHGKTVWRKQLTGARHATRY